MARKRNPLAAALSEFGKSAGAPERYEAPYLPNDARNHGSRPAQQYGTPEMPRSPAPRKPPAPSPRVEAVAMPKIHMPRPGDLATAVAALQEERELEKARMAQQAAKRQQRDAERRQEPEPSRTGGLDYRGRR